MVYGYARVSTAGQAKEGRNLEFQEAELRKNGAAEVYSDKFTGVKNDSPRFDALLEKLLEGDMLIVTKLDRIARSATDGINLVDRLIARGIKINILNIGILSSDTSGRIIRDIFFAFAEFERDLMIARAQAGKAVARTRAGFKEGRPKNTPRSN